jgi:hypothetical protein
MLGMTMNVTSSFISGSSGLSRDDFHHAFYGEAGYSVLRISRKYYPRKWTKRIELQFECTSYSFQALAGGYTNPFIAHYFTYHNHHLHYLDVV